MSEATTGLEAGAELDAAVDRAVFGKGWMRSDYCVINGLRQDIETWLPDEDWCSPDNPPGGWTWGETPPAYSTRIGAAWTVVEHMRANGHRFVLRGYSIEGSPYGCGFWPGYMSSNPKKDRYVEAETMPLAVCRAALAALAASGDRGEG